MLDLPPELRVESEDSPFERGLLAMTCDWEVYAVAREVIGRDNHAIQRTSVVPAGRELFAYGRGPRYLAPWSGVRERRRDFFSTMTRSFDWPVDADEFHRETEKRACASALKRQPRCRR
jgi:hypothetical protein